VPYPTPPSIGEYVGVPVICPVAELIDRPGVNAGVILYVYGAVPPEAVKGWNGVIGTVVSMT
jgi:hypothetical protein